jgi:hypothetical protein
VRGVRGSYVLLGALHYGGDATGHHPVRLLQLLQARWFFTKAEHCMTNH